jgi:hypothetical protein
MLTNDIKDTAVTKKSKLSSGCCGVLVVIGILFIAGLIYGIITNLQQSADIKLFQEHIEDYVSIPNQQAISPFTESYLTGKVITVDINKNEIDQIYFDLPEDLVAKTPEEVGTIIWLNWGEVLVGRYTDGAGGYRIICEVTIIDKANSEIIDKETLSGSDPISVKEGSGNRYGSKPTSEVIDYISTLPRK